MNRQHLRHHKTCLNCGTIVQERFCSHCGQENAEPKESFGHLIGHFLEDLTHYDSKLFTTIKDLVFKPGFLTRQYSAGKRAGYLNPIRMYIFISALFFLIIFSQKKEEAANVVSMASNQDVNHFRQRLADSLRDLVREPRKVLPADRNYSTAYLSLAARLDTAKTTDTSESVYASFNNAGKVTFHLQENKYANRSEYESDQQKLPASARDDRIMHYMLRKIIWLTHEKERTPELILTRNVAHDIPKIMFVLLPLFALFVGFFYSRKKYFYVQHIIFSLHFHSFVFILLMLESLVERWLPMDKLWLTILALTLLIIFIYLSAALRNVYRQALWLSIIKAICISILYVFALLLCFCAVIIISFMLL
jgi:hypothetical protein